MKGCVLVALLGSLGPVSALRGAPGDLDTEFDPGSSGGGFVPGIVRAVVAQPDGKVIIGGGIDEIAGEKVNGIGRLNTDGTVDSTFDPGTGANGPVVSLVLQSDGKVLLGGWFTMVNETSLRGVGRLNPDGSLDTTFDPGTGARRGFSAGRVWSVALQADGNVLIGGAFTTFNDAPRNLVARLLGDGSLDNAFDPGTWAEGTVQSIAVQRDGKVLVGGELTTGSEPNGIGIARLNTDGTLDSAFNPGTGAGHVINSIAVQPDGKVLLGGFEAGMMEGLIARLNTDGSLDSTFNPDIEAGQLVNSVALQPDGKVLLGGYEVGAREGFVSRLNTDGSLDSTFSVGADDLIWTVVVQPDLKVLVGGDFGEINGVFQVYVARLFGGPMGTLPSLSIEKAGGHVLLRWTDEARSLRSAPFVTGPYSDVSGATSPYTNEITGTQLYFQLSAN